MVTSGGLSSSEAQAAAREGVKGGVIGALKWGFGAALLGGAGYFMSPIYRRLTIQFKVFLQMSGMILGGCLEADHRIRDYETKVRLYKRMLKDQAAWEKYENNFGETSISKK